MKASLILGMVVLGALASAAPSARQSTGIAHIYATIQPNVQVSLADGAAIDAGTYQVGTITVTASFNVDANMQQLAFYAQASHLYKGDDPRNTEVAPIRLAMESAWMEASQAHPAGGASNHLPFQGTSDMAPMVAQPTVDGFPVYTSNTVVFESSQNNRFFGTVHVTVTWLQDDPEKSQGQYSGVVQLVAMTTPTRR